MISLIVLFLSGIVTGFALTILWTWPTEDTTIRVEDGKNPFRTPDWEPMSPYEDDSPDIFWLCDNCDCQISQEQAYKWHMCLHCEMADDEQRMMDRDKGDS